MRHFAFVVALMLVPGSDCIAQAPRDSVLTLAALQDSAARNDPRLRQLALLERQSELRRRSIASELLPGVAVESQAQYQSDVARVPLPGAPTPPHDTYDARVLISHRLFDPTRGPRRDLERAQLAQSQAAVRTTAYGTRQQVNEAFFSVLRAQVQADELRASISSMEAQRAVAAARVAEGAALPSEELALRAEELRRRQLLAEVDVLRIAAFDVLASLTGIDVDGAPRLVVPDLAGETAQARALLEARPVRSRPEFEQFARSRELLLQQERARAAQDLPRASTFGRAGYGQPGLNPLNDSFDSYWLAGIQLQWSPWTWGAGRRDREIIQTQREIIASEEAAFTDQLRRAVTQDLAAVARLDAAIRLDDDIIAARERIADETRARYAEGVVTSAEYVDRQTQLLSARLARALHRVELAQARTRLLTTLGIEMP